MKYQTSQPGITKKRDEVVTLTATSDQAHRVRHSKPKGNHDDLQIMADELEKLFAEYKLNVPTLPHQFPSRNTVPCVASFDSMSLPVPSHDCGHALSHSFSSYLNFGNPDSRGKYYDRYRIMRDAKLREEWKLNRAEKEARMKAMQDILHHTSACMNANFSGSIHSPSPSASSISHSSAKISDRNSGRRRRDSTCS